MQHVIIKNYFHTCLQTERERITHRLQIIKWVQPQPIRKDLIGQISYSDNFQGAKFQRLSY